MAEGRAPRNRTITLSTEDKMRFRARLLQISRPARLLEVLDRTLCQDAITALDLLPECSIDLLFADPPYNISKTFNGSVFFRQPPSEYENWLERWMSKLPRLMKKTGSLYICGDWRSSAAIQRVAERYFVVRNRITWEREKGRGATTNWKNNSEDVWFCTVSGSYTFNVDAVKLKRRVIAPYTEENGNPKDWTSTDEGKYRLTRPSNIWTDLTVPFWSMPENTDHPTQKPEKMLAKILLASSNPGDVVLDPFLGSGTTSVVCRKLQRRFVGIEIEETYCLLAEKRLEIAATCPSIQGYSDGIFWERNTLAEQNIGKPKMTNSSSQASLLGLMEQDA